MFVLHLLWRYPQDNRFYIWGETSRIKKAVYKNKSFSENKQALEHPFACRHNDIEIILEKTLGKNILSTSRSSSINLCLPSLRDKPLHSPRLILSESPFDFRAKNFKEWKVNALTFDTLALLNALFEFQEQSHDDVVFAESFSYWSTVVKFTIERIINKSFVPAIVSKQIKNKISCFAQWKPIFDHKNQLRFNQLVKAMPPACYSFMLNAEGEISLEPADIVYNFIQFVTDSFIRRTILPKEVFPVPFQSKKKGLSLAEHWIKKLFKGQSLFLQYFASERRAFVDAVNEWETTIYPAQTGAFRTCFRLEEPVNENSVDAQWQLGFYLQARDDMTLLVPSREVWEGDSQFLTFLKQKFEHPQERLLEDLGKALRVYPLLEESLKTAKPVSLKLDTQQAYDFLRNTSCLLEESGFGVLLPNWWQMKKRVGLKLRVKVKGKANDGLGLFGMDSIVTFDWQAAIGDESISSEEFEKLASLKVPIVKVRGEWVELNSSEMEKALSFFKESADKREMSLGDALRMGLGNEASESGLAVVDIEGEGLIKTFLNKLLGQQKVEDIDTPKRFKGELRPYQKRGLSWLNFLTQFGFGACLADDMGLGKTIQLIALLLHEREGKPKKKCKPALLVCPMSIVGNWQKEVERFAPSLRVMIHHGNERLSGKAFASEVKKNDIIITTYSLIHRDEAHLASIDWGCVVLDEAQNIKNPETKQTKAVMRLKANYKVALTGTPVENRLTDLWSIMSFLNHGFLGTANNFRSRFTLPIERYNDEESTKTLQRLVQPFILRRVKTDKSIIKDLPDKIEMDIFCNLTKEQATLYEAVVKDMMEKIEETEGIERKGLVLSTLMKLKQVCNHPCQFLHDEGSLKGRSGKLQRLEEMLEEVLASDDKALIFTQFSEMGEMLVNYFQKRFMREILFLYGGTTKKKRDKMVQYFQQEHVGPSIFILSLKAGGVGLNLTAANHVFHFDRWWNPAVENQATDRVFRIGQKKNVQVHKFVCVGTLEEKINEMINKKKDLADRIIQSGEKTLTELSTKQLKELFALNPNTIGDL